MSLNDVTWDVSGYFQIKTSYKEISILISRCLLMRFSFEFIVLFCLISQAVVHLLWLLEYV